jgi:hypothetical protein
LPNEKKSVLKDTALGNIKMCRATDEMGIGL